MNLLVYVFYDIKNDEILDSVFDLELESDENNPVICIGLL
jgi:hypothetical protein